MEINQVILVDADDNETGVTDKLFAHQKGLLHRAFSIFIFNNQGEMLLQQRALSKYHSGGLWTNACCSHPVPGEALMDGAHRRLKEEMGFDTELQQVFSFLYKADFDNGLTEHEFDHVFAGNYNGEIKLNKDEAMNYEFRSLNEIEKHLQEQPAAFSAWFQIAFLRIQQWWRSEFKNINRG